MPRKLFALLLVVGMATGWGSVRHLHVRSPAPPALVSANDPQPPQSAHGHPVPAAVAAPAADPVAEPVAGTVRDVATGIPTPVAAPRLGPRAPPRS